MTSPSTPPPKAGPRACVAGYGVLFETAVLIVALGLGWLLRRPPFAGLRFDATALGVTALAMIPLAGGTFWSLATDRPRVVRFRAQVIDLVAPLFADCGRGGVLAVSAAAGISEEALFRGVLLAAMIPWIGAPLALLVSSAIFGLAHFVTPLYAVLAGLGGLYLGGLYLLTGNILVPILVHALHDAVVLLLLLPRVRAEAGPRRP